MAAVAPTAKVLPVSAWTSAATIVLESAAAAPPWKNTPAAAMRQNRRLASASCRNSSIGAQAGDRFAVLEGLTPGHIQRYSELWGYLNGNSNLITTLSSTPFANGGGHACT